MRIISWNCRGKFREKYNAIKKENADVYVIQECENPEKYKDDFSGFCSEYIWVGEKDSKGLCIFVNPLIKMVLNEWPSYCLRHFLSVKINDEFDLLGVWAGPPYIAEYYVYQSINIEKYSDNTIIIGDFNSNVIWDKDYGARSHSMVVKEINMISAYHYTTGDEEGKEKQSTFYMYKHLDKKYHIDYCFLDPKLIKSFRILEGEEWLKYSDHMPLMLEV